MKKKPLILAAMGLPRHSVFKDSAFTTIADITVLDVPGIKNSLRKKLQPWVDQVAVGLAIKELKDLSKT